MLNIRCPRRLEFFDDKEVRSVACGASWSTVTSSAGDLYSFGYGDGGWLALGPPPPGLPQVEIDLLSPGQAANLPAGQQELCCFDSRHSVMVPRRVSCLSAVDVKHVRAGAGHMILFCEPRPGTGAGAGDAPNSFSTSTSSSGGNSYSNSGEVSYMSGSKSSRDFGSSGGSNLNASGNRNSWDFKLGADAGGSEKGCGNGNSSNSLSKGTGSGAGGAAQHQHHQRTAATPSSYISSGSEHPPTPNSTSGKSSAFQQGQGQGQGPTPLRKASTAPSGIGSSHGGLQSPSAQLFSWCRHKKVSELAAHLESSSEAAADVFAQDLAGNTPLIVACQNGHLQLVKVLLAHGADLNARNHKGNSALHYCFNYGYEEIGNYLIGCGADEFQTNAEGLTCYEGLTHSDLELL
jgi:hypothetical protein